MDLSTPEAAVRSFIDALNALDAKQAEDCVLDANRRVRGPLLERMEWRKKGHSQLTVTDVYVEMDGRYAFAIIHYGGKQMNTTDGKQISFKTTDIVRLVNMRLPTEPMWQLLSIDPQHHWSPAQGGSLQMEVTAIAHPELYAAEAECRVRIRRLAPLIMYTIVGENNGRLAVAKKGAVSPAGPEGQPAWSFFKRAAATYEDAKQNYFPLKEFHCPADGTDNNVESYAFNDKLEDSELKKLAEPANTVLVYEGKDGKLTFRHGGRAHVTFADGHVELIDEAQAKTLRWVP